MGNIRTGIVGDAFRATETPSDADTYIITPRTSLVTASSLLEAGGAFTYKKIMEAKMLAGSILNFVMQQIYTPAI